MSERWQKRIELAVAVVVLGLGSATAGEKGQGLSAEEALKRLEEGNARFVADTPQHPHEARPWRSRLEKGQQPFAVILGCSDSRVPPELVFDQRFGDLFVVRVAGNVVDTDVTASIEYAVDHLGTRLILVLGHSHCGAVTAALDLLGDPDGEPAEIVSLLYRMEPAVMGLPKQLTREQRIEQAVSRNVQRSVQRLSRVPDLRRKMKAGTIRIVGAVFDMHTGQVELVK